VGLGVAINPKTTTCVAPYVLKTIRPPSFVCFFLIYEYWRFPMAEMTKQLPNPIDPTHRITFPIQPLFLLGSRTCSPFHTLSFGMAGAAPLSPGAVLVAADPVIALTSGPTLLVATDCSGLGSPVLVLARMGLPWRHIWASDVEKACRTMLRRHCAPDHLYRSIYDRPDAGMPQPDLYVVGFPCQPFSGAGLRRGFEGTGGTIFFKVLETIRLTRPKAFLLENVEGLRSADQGRCMENIVDSLQLLGTHTIYWQVLNTKDHGIPQNRARVFFVGILRGHDNGSFAFPSPSPHMDIRQFLDRRHGRPSFADLPPAAQATARGNVLQALHKIEAAGGDPFHEPWIIDCDGGPEYTKALPGVSPCMTRARYFGHWLTSMGRRMSLQEALRLQGFDDCFVNEVSERQLRMMLGNCMSLNVLERIFCRLLPAAGLSGPLRDPLIGDSVSPWRRQA
jgi:DNA (cytosine-5)-methyltransferase 1